MPTMRKVDAVKRAMIGLIGDNRKTIMADLLYLRVKDQCARIGEYAPAWSVFVDGVRLNGGSFSLRNGRAVIRLPKRMVLKFPFGGK